jgi:hypothetical protein
MVRYEEMSNELTMMSEKVMAAELYSKKTKTEFMRLRKHGSSLEERCSKLKTVARGYARNSPQKQSSHEKNMQEEHVKLTKLLAISKNSYKSNLVRLRNREKYVKSEWNEYKLDAEIIK